MRIIHSLSQFGTIKLLHPFLEDEVRVEEYSVLSSKEASDCDRISVKPEQGTTIYLP